MLFKTKIGQFKDFENKRKYLIYFFYFKKINISLHYQTRIQGKISVSLQFNLVQMQMRLIYLKLKNQSFYLV